MEHETQHHTATFEKINATLDRIAEMQEQAALEMKEQRKEEERRREEEKLEAERRREEADREIKEIWEQMKDTDRRLKKTDELFNTQWGKLMESLVEGDLVPLLQKRNIPVTHTLTGLKGRHNGEHVEYDILAENGEEVVVVEVKTTLRPEDVGHFLKQLGKFTTYRPLYKARKIHGAVAFLKADKSVQVHAERQGLFVIRATGSSASIVNDTEFVPRVF